MEQLILKQYNLLPRDLQKEVEDFIQSLFQKNMNQPIEKKAKPVQKMYKPRRAGFSKAKFEMSADFNAPLDEKMEPVQKIYKPRIAGFGKGKITMSADFNAPLEDFKDYM